MNLSTEAQNSGRGVFLTCLMALWVWQPLSRLSFNFRYLMRKQWEWIVEVRCWDSYRCMWEVTLRCQDEWFRRDQLGLGFLWCQFCDGAVGLKAPGKTWTFVSICINEQWDHLGDKMYENGWMNSTLLCHHQIISHNLFLLLDLWLGSNDLQWS